MEPNDRGATIVPDLREAISAYQSGNPARATAIARTITSAEPHNAGAHYLLGVVAADTGDLDGARQALETAVSLAPDNANFHITLGNVHLARRDDEAAERSFRAALALAPNSVPAHSNLGTALKRQGRLEAAVAEFHAALLLLRASRWLSGGDAQRGAIDPTQEATFKVASRAKLAHDLAQFRYLLERNRLPAEFAAEIANYDSVLAAFGETDEPAKPRALSSEEQRRIDASFNRLVYLPPDAPLVGPAINPALDYTTLEETYNDVTPHLIVIDNLLSAAALAALRRFCVEATIWFDCKEQGGYLGAYMNDGFDAPVLVQLADELSKRVPAIFGQHHLAQMWAFKYGPSGVGTRKHADKAAVNVNFWITPDEACLEPDSGGLRVHPVAAPPDWDFQRYNREVDDMEARVAAAGQAPIDVPYRCNRCVVFDSSLIHETMPLRFRDGYDNRRINVTMLFGDRVETHEET